MGLSARASLQVILPLIRRRRLSFGSTRPPRPNMRSPASGELPCRPLVGVVSAVLSTVGPQIRRGDPLNLSISISGGKATNQDSPSNGERSGNSSSRQSLVSIASELWPAEADAPETTPSKLTWKGTSERVIAPCVAESSKAATVFEESGCLGVQPKVGGKLHLKPNNGTRPIANKYREGKVKSTLERELKRPRNRWEGNACSRTGPRRVQGAALRPVRRRHPRGSLADRGVGLPCTLGGRGRPSGADSGRRALVGQVAQPSLAEANLQPAVRSARSPPRREVAFPPVQRRSVSAGRGALVRSASRLCHCTQCPAELVRPEGRSSHALRFGSLASRRLHSTRLETRTKECSSCASSSGVETRRCTMKVKAGRVARRGESR